MSNPLVFISSLISFGLIGFFIRHWYGIKSSRAIEARTKEMLRDTEYLKQKLEEDKHLFYKKKEREEQDLLHLRKETHQMQKELSQKEKEIFMSQTELNHKLKNLEGDILQLEQERKQLNLAKNELSVERDKIKSYVEKISNLTEEEARKILLEQLSVQLEKEKYSLIQKVEEETKNEAKTKARDIILSAIQRIATDVTSESSVSVITLPGEEMKGRIIGKEGRNIRVLETTTGVDIIIDDTPETVLISSFDSVRREIAKRTIESLIHDGRIQPSRIEEIHQKITRDIEKNMEEAGEEACFQLGLQNVHPTLKSYVGRMQFRSSYGQNLLKHSIEVANIAAMLAADLSLDVEIVKRGALFHDVGKVIMGDNRGHVAAGADLAKHCDEKDEIINCILAHHEDVPHSSAESLIVRLADAISAARPGARRDSFERYVERLEKLEKIALEFPEIEKAFAIQAGRELRILVNSADTSDERAKLLAREVASKIEDNLRYPGQIRVTVMRETRFVEYAT